MTLGRLAAAGVAAYLVVLLLTVPAQYLRSPLDDLAPGLRAGHLDGSVLAGTATPVALAGLVVDEARWRWRPTALLRGRIAFDVTLHAGGSSLNLEVARAPWSAAVELADARGTVDLAWLGEALPNPPLRGRGRLQLDGVALALGPEGWPAGASGRLALHAAEVTAPVPLRIGAATAMLAQRDARLELAFTLADDAPIRGTGSATLEPAGGYRVQARLQPSAAADPDQVALLRLAGRSEADGSIRFDLAGTLGRR